MSARLSQTRTARAETLRREEVRREKYNRMIDANGVNVDPLEFDEEEALILGEALQHRRECFLWA